MEFLRFGSSIPGSYWGCCAICIIQNLSVDPDAKASIQIVNGDSGSPITKGGEFIFAGKTYRDIFLQRLRYGTFGRRDLPNHAFLVSMTSSQLGSEIGKKWLQILKEQGFEFIRTVDNSVYTGAGVVEEAGEFSSVSSHPNYLFGLFRNVGKGAVPDPFSPPKEWTDLPSVVPEAWESSSPYLELAVAQQAAQLPLYNALPKDVYFTEGELEKDGVPIWYAGERSNFPQEVKAARQAKKGSSPASVAPWGEPDDYDEDYEEEDDYEECE